MGTQKIWNHKYDCQGLVQVYLWSSLQNMGIFHKINPRTPNHYTYIHTCLLQFVGSQNPLIGFLASMSTSNLDMYVYVETSQGHCLFKDHPPQTLTKLSKQLPGASLNGAYIDILGCYYLTLANRLRICALQCGIFVLKFQHLSIL